jgi:hypothetical protein
MERIASCVSAGLPTNLQNSSAIIDRYFATRDEMTAFGFENLDFATGLAERYASPLRLYYFAGLLELGVSVGYVDLGAWPDLPRFEAALGDLLERESSQPNHTDLFLVRELLGRLEKKKYCVGEIDNDGFHVFSSYLHLTSALYRDDRAISFIDSTISWRRGINDDLAFLISPRHFVAALGSGSISGIPATK